MDNMHFVLILYVTKLFAFCPHCDGNNLELTKYEVSLHVLKDRSWITCSDCDYEIEVDKLKKQLWCS